MRGIKSEWIVRAGGAGQTVAVTASVMMSSGGEGEGGLLHSMDTGGQYLLEMTMQVLVWVAVVEADSEAVAVAVQEVICILLVTDTPLTQTILTLREWVKRGAEDPGPLLKVSIGVDSSEVEEESVDLEDTASMEEVEGVTQGSGFETFLFRGVERRI
jgi:hypothetical protein